MVPRRLLSPESRMILTVIASSSSLKTMQGAVGLHSRMAMLRAY
jgi:hypothetical protein